MLDWLLHEEACWGDVSPHIPVADTRLDIFFQVSASETIIWSFPAL